MVALGVSAAVGAAVGVAGAVQYRRRSLTMKLVTRNFHLKILTKKSSLVAPSGSDHRCVVRTNTVFETPPIWTYMHRGSFS